MFLKIAVVALLILNLYMMHRFNQLSILEPWNPCGDNSGGGNSSLIPQSQ